MGRNQNMCGKSNIKRKTSPKRTSQLFRLLYRETRFEIKTNRRIRNRTYGGVRGRNFSIKRNSSYSIVQIIEFHEIQFFMIVQTVNPFSF